MAKDIKNLPPVLVHEDLYELMRTYAFNNKLSMSGAIRQLILESPEIRQLAHKQGVDLSKLVMKGWGGDRYSDTDRSENEE